MTSSQARLEFQQSLDLFKQQDFKSSRVKLLRLVAYNPKNGAYWLNLGLVNFSLEDYAAAEQNFLMVETNISPLKSAAQFYRAKVKQAQGDYAGAQATLQELLKSNSLTPGIRMASTQLLFDLRSNGSVNQQALALYRRRQYKKSLQLLNKNRPDTPDRQVLRSLILVQLDREDEAYRILQKLEEQGHSPENRDFTQTLVESIRNANSKPKWLTFEAAGGHSSNIQRSVDAEDGNILMANLSGGARLWSKDLWKWSAGYLGWFNETLSHSDLRILSHEINSNFGYELGQELFSLQPFVSHESWGGSPALLSYGIRLHWQFGSSKQTFGLDAEASRLEAQNSSLNCLSGSGMQIRPQINRMFFPVYGQAFLNVQRQDIGDQTYSSGDSVPMGYTGWGPGGQLIGSLSKKWNLNFSVSFMQKKYDGLAQPSGVKRVDRETIYGSRLTFLVQPNLSIYLAYSDLRNTSTLTDDNSVAEGYQQSQVILGSVWDIL